MGLFDKILGKKRPANAAADAADRARQAHRPKNVEFQSPEEQQATRTRMEADMSDQRQRRAAKSPPDA